MPQAIDLSATLQALATSAGDLVTLITPLITDLEERWTNVQFQDLMTGVSALATASAYADLDAEIESRFPAMQVASELSSKHIGTGEQLLGTLLEIYLIRESGVGGQVADRLYEKVSAAFTE